MDIDLKIGAVFSLVDSEEGNDKAKGDHSTVNETSEIAEAKAGSICTRVIDRIGGVMLETREHLPMRSPINDSPLSYMAPILSDPDTPPSLQLESMTKRTATDISEMIAPPILHPETPNTGLLYALSTSSLVVVSRYFNLGYNGILS